MKRSALPLVNRSRFLGHMVTLCRHRHGSKFVLATQGVWAEVAGLLDQPLGVVAGDEVADRLAHVLDGLKDVSMDNLLLLGAEEPLDDAVRSGWPTKRNSASCLRL